MKILKLLFVSIALHTFHLGYSQETKTPLKSYWQVGLGLGELPLGGSFKPSITFGYHFNDKLYAGVIYQFKDKISRDQSSINAKSSGLEGLTNSSETVAQRFLLQVRYTPIKNGPYISTGLVYNGQDSEYMTFDDRDRTLYGQAYSGSINIQQTRPAGWGYSLGIGYQYNFKNGLSTGFEWTPAWGQYPSPSYAIDGSANLLAETKAHLQNKMDDEFKSSVTNMYKVFHIGVAYRFN